jgi:catalase
MADLPMSAVDKVKNMVAGEKGRKIAQLGSVTQSVTKDDRITTDFGVKQSTADDWLRANSGDRIGPALLEDSYARERVIICSLE